MDRQPAQLKASSGVCRGSFAAVVLPYTCRKPEAAKAVPLRRHSGEAGIQSRAVKQPCVYILASRRNGTLYTGVTSNLAKRVWEHKEDLIEGFTKRYGVHTLVWYEPHDSMESAIRREKVIKGWKRRWKLALIEQANRGWRDLYEDLQ